MATQPTVPVSGIRTWATASVTTAADGLSDVIDIGGGTVAALVCSSTAWTAAALTFLGSVSSSAALQSVHHTTSMTELTYLTSGFTSGQFGLAVDPTKFQGFRYVQFRSGTKSAAVAQAAARTILVGLVPAT